MNETTKQTKKHLSDYALVEHALLSDAVDFIESFMPGGLVEGEMYQWGVEAAGCILTVNMENGAWGFVYNSDKHAEQMGTSLISLYMHHHDIHHASEAIITLADLYGVEIKFEDMLLDLPPEEMEAKIVDEPTRSWTYMTESGLELQIVDLFHLGKIKIWRAKNIDARLDKNEKVEIFWRKGWKRRVPVFDAHIINNATNSHKSVLFVQNEEVMDRVRLLLGEKSPIFVTTAATLKNGVKKSKRTDSIDMTPLDGRTVVFLPDNTRMSKEAMLEVAIGHESGLLLNDVGLEPVTNTESRAFLIKATGPRGWSPLDYNEAKNGRFVDWLKNHNQNHKFTTGSFDSLISKTEHQRKSLDEKPIPVELIDNLPFKALGIKRDRRDGLTYMIVSHYTGAMFELAAENLGEAKLLQIAPYDHWLEMFRGGHGINWKIARNTIMSACHAKGYIDINKIRRGRGVWSGRGNETLIHTGEHLWIGGKGTYVSPTRSPSFMMERCSDIGLGKPDVATADELEHAYFCYHKIHWAHIWMAKFLHGWALCAPFSGLLDWRTHVSVTGPSGAGKSTIARELVGKCLGNFCVTLEGGTTEAGLRRQLGIDAFPVIFDENEKTGRGARQGDVVKEVLHLARVASSESGGVIQHGDGNVYRPRSMFYFNWVDPSMEEEADTNRFVVCELLRPKDQRNRITHFNEFIEAAHRIGPNYWRRAFWWVYSIMNEWVRTTRIFRELYERAHGSPRKADSMAPIYALSYLSINLVDGKPSIPTHEQAALFLGSDDSEVASGMEAIRDEENMLSYLLHYTIRFTNEVTGDHGQRDRLDEMTVSEMITYSYFEQNQQGAICKALKRFGCKTFWREGQYKNMVAFAHAGHGIGQAMMRSRWQTGWWNILKRLPGAKIGKSPVKYTGRASRWVALPIDTCLDKDTVAEIAPGWEGGST